MDLTGNCYAVRIRPPGQDDDGDPIDGPDDELTIEPAIIAPGATADILDRGREGVTVDATLYLPFGADVAHTDLFRITDAANLNGTYTISGNAESWRSPFTGWQAGDVVALQRAAG